MALAPGLSNPFSTTRRFHHFNSFTQPYTILRLSSSSSSFNIRSSTKSIVAAALKENNFGALEKKKKKKKMKNWIDFTSLNYWVVRDYHRLVDSVNSLEHHIQTLSDEELAAKTEEFRHRLVRQGETLAQIHSGAFAVVREAAKRKLGMRHFDVQIIGGAVLHDGSIAEVKTGEGKTLVSTLAASAATLFRNKLCVDCGLTLFMPPIFAANTVLAELDAVLVELGIDKKETDGQDESHACI